MTDPNLPAVFEQQEQSETVQPPADGKLRPKPIWVAGAIILYACLLWASRMAGAPVFQEEAAEHMLAAQSLQLGYTLDRPPLAAWVLALADMTVGLSKPVFFGLAYTVLAGGLLAFYAAARIMFTGPASQPGEPETREDLAAAATGAWALSFFVGWEIQGDKIAAIFSFALLSMTVHAYIAAAALGKGRDWAYFGAAAGLGSLASYWHPILVVGLLIGGRTIHAMRPALSASRIAYATFIGVLILGPFVYWLSTQPVLSSLQLFFNPSGWFEIEAIAPFVQGLARQLIGDWAQVALPAFIIWLLLFWPLWFPYIYPFFPHRWLKENTTHRAWRGLAARATWIGLIIAGALIVWRLQPLPGEAVLAGLMLAPLWMFQHVRRASPFPIAMRAFLIIVSAAIIAACATRALAWRSGPEAGCRTEQCDAYLPTAAWAEALETSGFQGGTLVGADPLLTGNLRRSLTEARVMDAAYARSMFPDADNTMRACLAVWRSTPTMPEDLADYLRDSLGVRLTDRNPGGALRRTYVLSDSEAATLYYRFLRPSAECR